MPPVTAVLEVKEDTSHLDILLCLAERFRIPHKPNSGYSEDLCSYGRSFLRTGKVPEKVAVEAAQFPSNVDQEEELSNPR